VIRENGRYTYIQDYEYNPQPIVEQPYPSPLLQLTSMVSLKGRFSQYHVKLPDC
jgi:hypothetical protein